MDSSSFSWISLYELLSTSDTLVGSCEEKNNVTQLQQVLGVHDGTVLSNGQFIKTESGIIISMQSTESILFILKNQIFKILSNISQIAKDLNEKDKSMMSKIKKKINSKKTP